MKEKKKQEAEIHLYWLTVFCIHWFSFELWSEAHINKNCLNTLKPLDSTAKAMWTCVCVCLRASTALILLYLTKS